MSIFSKVRNAKKAADQHKQQQAEVEKPKAAPYKHVPTHAAQDAMSSAPSSWSVEESRAKVAAYHKRKSTMSRTNSEMSMATMGSIATHQPGMNRAMSDASLPSVMSQPRRSYRHSHSPYAYSAGVPPVPSVPVRFSNSQLSNYPGTSSVASSRPASISAHRRRSPLSASEEGAH
jgi:hypothetical protein